MKALVTGAGGFIGHHLVAELLERGWHVRGLDDFSTGHPERIEPFERDDRFTFQEGDVVDRAVVSDLVQGCRAVFHQAAVPSVPRSWSEPERVTRANCLGTTVLLEAARTAEVPRVVVASSSSVYGERAPGEPKREDMCPEPRSPYALTKLWTETLASQYADNYPMEAVALRYFNVFGPGQDPTGDYAAVIPKFIQRMTEGLPPVIYGDGEQTRDFTYVANVVTANLAAAEEGAPSGVYNVGVGERHSVNDLVRLVGELLDVSPDPVHDDPRPGDVRHSLADLDRIRENLGYRPQVDFVEGLRRTVHAFTRENASSGHFAGPS